MRSKRIQWLDFGKGFTILCVLLFHCTQFIFPHSMLLLRNILEVFMMPVFFAISGFLYKPDYTRKKYFLLIYKKISGFIIPYSFFAILLFLLNKYYFLYQTPWQMSHNIGVHVVFFHGAYLWFLSTLFIIFLLIASIIYLFKSKIIYEKLGLICLSILFLILAKHMISLKAFAFWLICFIIGYYFKRFKLYKFYTLMHKIQIPSYILWIILLYIQFHIENASEYNTGANPVSVYSFLPALLSILLFFMTFILFNHNNKIFRYFCEYGKYTLFIYLIHFPIMLIIGKWIKILPFPKYILLVILLIIVWILSFESCKLLQYSIFHFLFYPKKYISKEVAKTKWGYKLLNC